MSIFLKEKINQLKEYIKIDKSFDIIGREVKILNRDGYLVFIDGFTKDEIMYYILNYLQNSNGNIKTIDELIDNRIGYIEVEKCNDYNKMSESVLSGMCAIFIDDFEEFLLIDSREYPVRSISEAETEKVTLGSKDSFVETIIFNTALVRRRIRTKDLVFETMNVGTVSKTDIAIAYMDDRVDKVVLEDIKNRLSKIKTEDLLGGGNYIDELIFDKKWYNPLPQVKYTERPDVLSSYLLEGHVTLIIDTSPYAIILPVTLFYFTQYVDDYNKNMIVGTLTRIMRFFSIALALYLTPLWMFLAENQQFLGNNFSFIGVKEEAVVGLFYQFLILEIGFMLLQLSSLHIPNYLGGAFGIIGGLLVGDIAVKVGIFSIEPIFYMSLTAIATYCIPSVEFSNAIRIFRLFILICTGLFGLLGLIISTIIITLISYKTETISGSNKYLWPLLPFDWKHLKYILFRIR